MCPLFSCPCGLESEDWFFQEVEAYQGYQVDEGQPDDQNPEGDGRR